MSTPWDIYRKARTKDEVARAYAHRVVREICQKAGNRYPAGRRERRHILPLYIGARDILRKGRGVTYHE